MKKYMIIRRNGNHLGLFSYVITNMGAINYALKNNMIPIIDMMNVQNMYLEEKDVSKKNAWEFYFEQPCNIGLGDVNIDDCLISEKVFRNRPSDSMRFFMNKKKNNYWKELSCKYLRLKPEVKRIIDNYQKQYFKSKDKIVGVLCRGTDYINLKPFRHPVQPSISEMFNKIDEVIKNYKCNKVFLATEDEQVLNQFKQKYKNKLIYHNQQRYSHTQKEFLAYVSSERENDRFLRGLEYLTSIVLLSRCNCFVGGVTSGTVGVELFNPQYEYKYFFNEGRYGMPKFFKYYYKQK